MKAPRPAQSPKRPQPKPPVTLSRARLREIVQHALETPPFVHALWEGGSTAFARDDGWSDVDLLVVVDDDQVEATFQIVEEAVAKVCPIACVHTVPMPSWHGHAQRFYQFKDQPPWLMLDLCVMQRSNKNRFLEPEIHGEAKFLFDRIQLAASIQPLDREAWDDKLRERVRILLERTRVLAVLVDKECRRRRALDAMAFYQSLIIAPLVEMLRIRHDPWRHNFGLRYLHDRLPGPLARRLQEICFVRNLDDLQAKQRIALRWLHELANEISRQPHITHRVVAKSHLGNARP